jgi:hypothetical protein
MPDRDIRIQVVKKDLFSQAADVLGLMHPEPQEGVTGLVAELAERMGPEVLQHVPRRNDFSFFPTNGRMAARAVLLVGTPPLNYQYGLIRAFAAAVLAQLEANAPETRTLCLSAQGSGYGLDAREAFRAEVAGIADALESGRYPQRLESIVVAERDPRRVKLLKEVLAEMVPAGTVQRDIEAHIDALPASAARRFRAGGEDAAQRPHVFVSMPFADTEDLYNYGIYQPVSASGYLCERQDHQAYTGDILAHLKQRIDTAELVVAELTGGNPNVYLEVGYAWGRGIPTVLLALEGTKLPFNVSGQRCLHYRNLTHLSQSLRSELAALHRK